MSAIDIIEQVTVTETAESVRPMVMASQIILRKWHTRNNKFEECSLRELWENGFENGQSFQANNLHLFNKKYLDGSDLHMNSAFFDEVWKAFWSDLSDVEVVFKRRLHNDGGA